MDSPVAKSKTRPITLLAASLLIIIVAVIVVSKEMDTVRAFILGSGWVGVVVSVLIYALLGISPIPSEPVTVLISTIYGPFQATLVAGVGNLLAAVVEYYIGIGIGDVASFEKQRARLPFGLGRFPVDSPIFLIAVRSLPGYGPKFISVLAGIYRVPMYRYLWTAAIPTLVGAAIFAYGGFGLISMQPK